MGSPLGPLMANAFMCSAEEKLACENKLPSFYKRYVDHTLALVRDLSDATNLLACLNEAHPSIQFTMEVATNNRLPFIGMEIIKIDGSLETCVYRKKTNKGLLLSPPVLPKPCWQPVQTVKCSIGIHMWFVRYKLYWVHLPSSPLTRRGT